MTNKLIVQENISMEEILTPIQLKIIDILKKAGPMTRDEICESFGYKKYTYKSLSYNSQKSIKSHKPYHHQSHVYHKRTTIYNNLLKLKKRKVVKKFTKNNGKRGRPLVLWKLVEV